MADQVSRKDFVAIVGTAAAVEILPEAAEAAKAPAKHAPVHKPQAKALQSEPEAYTYFTDPESAFVEAAADRLIPADELGPGGREAGVAFYIDQQLGGQFGYAAKMYQQGPWVSEASSDFGYQLPLNPRQVYRLGIAETNAYCTKTYGKTFDKLSAAHQDDVLTALDNAKLTFASVPCKTFFEMLYGNAVEGFFADPMYGGNRNKTGWKLVGFPGAAAAYYPFIEKHNVPYHVQPQSIADLQQSEESTSAMSEMDRHIAIAKKALGVK